MGEMFSCPHTFGHHVVRLPRMKVSMALFLHACIGLKSYFNNKTGRYTHVKEVSCHAAAMALFVPVRFLAAGVVDVSRQAAVVAVLIGTLTGQVAWGATKEAGCQLLHTHTQTYIYIYRHNS